MFKELTKVFGETIVYGLTGIASTLASIFLVPVYTRVFNPGDYGVSALLGTLFSIIAVVANLGMSSAIFRSYFMAKKEERSEVAGTAFIFQTLFPLLISGIAFAMSGRISQVLFGSDNYSLLVSLSSAALFFNAGIAVPLALLRAEGRPTNFVSVTLTKLFVTILVSLILVVGLRMGLAGVFWGNLAGAVLGYLMGVVYTLRRISLVVSKHWLREMLEFGVPLVPGGLAMWVLNSSDRYFLNAFSGTADVGIYNVGYKVGNLVTLAVGALQLAYPRFLWAIYNEKPNPKEYFRKINTYFYLITFTLALGVSIFAKEAIQVLTGSAFHSAYLVVPLIAFSYVAYGLYLNFSTGVSVMKKTYLSAIAVIISGVLNLVLNYVLISRFGMMGAAASTLLSFAVLALIGLQFSQRVYRIPFEFRRLLTVLLSGVILVFASAFVDFGLALSILIKSLLMFAFPALLYLLGFFEKNELKKLAQIWAVVKEARFQPRRILDNIRQEMIT